MNADEAQQQMDEQREMEESIEASRKLSHAFKAECKEFFRTFPKWNIPGVRHGHE